MTRSNGRARRGRLAAGASASCAAARGRRRACPSAASCRCRTFRLVAVSSTIRTCSPLSRWPAAAAGRDRRRAAARSSNQNVEPAPGVLSTPIRPPISSTSCLEIARPRPVPPYLRVVEASAWRERSEEPRRAVCRRCRCRCRVTAKRSSAASVAARARVTAITTSPALGELDGVADQVDQDLAQAAGVADARAAGMPRHRCGPPARAPWPRAARRAAGRRRPRPCRAGRRRCGSSSSLPASIFEKSRMSLMMREQRLAGVAHRLRVVALLGGQRRVEQQLGHADHAVHRRADLVAHVGQELALGPARRLGRVARLPQLLLRALVRGDVAVRRHEAAPAHGVVLDLDDPAIGQLPLDPARLELARLGDPLRDLRRRVTRAEPAALGDHTDELIEGLPHPREVRREPA